MNITVQYSQYHLLKRLSWPNCMFLPRCQLLIDSKCISLLLGSVLCFIDLCVCFYAGTILFWLLWLCSIAWYQVAWFLQLFSFFSRLLFAVQGLLWFHIYFWNICFSCVKYAISIFFLKILYSFIFWEKGREGERGREASMCGYLLRDPYWGLACNPGMCLDWESNRWPFSAQAGAQSTEPHQPGLLCLFWWLVLFIIIKCPSFFLITFLSWNLFCLI